MTDLSKLSQAELIAMVQTMQATPAKRLSLKVSTKGALSLYGLGRFPVTLYRGQWERLLSAKDELEAFIAANAASLSVKPEA
jgi:hypothetical protein